MLKRVPSFGEQKSPDFFKKIKDLAVTNKYVLSNGSSEECLLLGLDGNEISHT